MYRLWISTCCFIVCLIIHYTPSSYCAATALSSSKPQHPQQQEQQDRQAEIVDPKRQSAASDGKEKVADEPGSQNTYTFTTGSRNKRELTDSRDVMKMAKRIRSFVGKRERDLNLGNSAAGSEYPGYPPVQVWLDTDDGELYLSYPEDEESVMDNSIDDPHDDEVYRDISKRIRSFVGKRGSTQFGVPYDSGWQPEDDQELEMSKRLRSFVGKRLRSFIGKRDDIDKRTRHFVGKRVRSFVGKRDGEYDFGNELFMQDKRPRSFVGKRLRSFVGKRVRSFVGKRENGLDEQIRDQFGDPDLRNSALFSSLLNKRVRSFVGKRSYGDEWDTLELPSPYTFGDGFDLSADKRLRSFVGKRSMDDEIEAQKRLRSFVGKREDKRIRSFVGKRSDDAPDEQQIMDLDVSQPSKRLRSFVGKRSDRDTTAVERSMKSKRLRDFVGKRDAGVSKRLRSFVGRR